MNFILFIPDEMRAESVSCYDHPLVQMPNYDRLAAEGVRFDQCHVQHTVCSPARCSLMTGWYPHVSGHRTLWHLLRPWEPSLFKYLRDAGYHIEWHGKNDLYAADCFPQAVDNFDAEGGKGYANVPWPKDDPRFYSFLAEPEPIELDETADMNKMQAGIDFLRSRKKDDKPFVLFLPTSMPHPTYVCPQPYYDMYDPADIPPLRPAELPNKPDYFTLIRQYRNLENMPPEQFAKIQAVYLGMNSYVDWMLGQLLDTLDETGLADETTVIVTSDHGDWAGDYGLVEKWPSGLDDCLTRVPLLIRSPGNEGAHVVREQVEWFDIMATMLDLAGVEAEHVHFAQSLCDQLRGAPGDPDRAIYAEGGYDPHEPHCFEGKPIRGDIGFNPDGIYYPKGLQQQEHPESVCRSTMIRTMQHKLIRRTAGQNELYDLEQDPRELKNVYDEPDYAHVRAALESRMLDWYVHSADAVPPDPDPRGLPPKS